MMVHKVLNVVFMEFSRYCVMCGHDLIATIQMR